jgi:hypothetical protein
MKAIYYTGLLSVLLVAGCNQSYTVYVNGFSQAPNAVPAGARIYVVSDHNSANPVFDNQVKVKIVKILSSRGYVPVDDPKSEYRLTFNYGVYSHLEEDYRYVGGGVGFNRRHFGSFGTYDYVPNVRTTWDQWLSMKVHKGDDVVWVGEAVTSKYYADKRQAVDYLVVALVSRFGQDTKKQEVITLNKDDPRLIDIESFSQ